MQQVCVHLGNIGNRASNFNVQVEDNGAGIPWTDFQLLCERYCSSRRGFEEDDKMARKRYYGKRGEVVIVVVFEACSSFGREAELAIVLACALLMLKHRNV